MAQRKIYEGTLEEITALHGLELRGRRIQITVEDETAAAGHALPWTSSTDWARALTNWAAGHSSIAPYLSNEAIGRDSIYEGRV